MITQLTPARFHLLAPLLREQPSAPDLSDVQAKTVLVYLTEGVARGYLLGTSGQGAPEQIYVSPIWRRRGVASRLRDAYLQGRFAAPPL